MPKEFRALFGALLAAAATAFGADSKPGYAARLQWNINTTVGDYERCGHKDPKWDADAKKALGIFAEMLSGQNSDVKLEEFRKAARSAIDLGCDDPLLRYLAFRHGVLGAQNAAALGKNLSELADALAAGGYSPIRVFYVSDRAARALFNTGGENNPNVHRYRKRAAQALAETLRDKKTPFDEVYIACHEMIAEVQYSPADMGPVWDQVEKPLVENWPDQPLTYNLKGWALISKGWAARGYGYADTVTETGWKTLKEDLTLAQAALEKGWRMDTNDSRMPCQMLTVALGLPLERGEMEKWFGRAMAANTNCYEAGSAKLEFLKPKWFGSDEVMLAFGRECVASKKWGGHVPLILLDARRDIASRIQDTNQVSAYWNRADVWRDLHRSFEKFFALNPDEIGWRHDYAKAAYDAGQWKLFLDQCKLMRAGNYEFFGGLGNFQKMKEEAQRRVSEERPAAK
jgi:hypothetical protein